MYPRTFFPKNDEKKINLSKALVLVILYLVYVTVMRFNPQLMNFLLKMEMRYVIKFYHHILSKMSFKNYLDKQFIKKISQILITSNTLSSSKIISKIKLKKVIHQFFPIDNNLITKRFIDHWKPSMALFIDSEIWPNMLINLNRNNIPTILLNARITKKTFLKWKMLKNFSEKIFNKITIAYPQNLETKYFLKKLKVKKIKTIGNLKFAEYENEKINKINL